MSSRKRKQTQLASGDNEIRFNRRTKEHSHFSNMFPDVNHNTSGVGHVIVSFDGKSFPSVEHAYQYAMFKYGVGDPEYATIISSAASGRNAKEKSSVKRYCEWKARNSSDTRSKKVLLSLVSEKKKNWRQREGRRIMEELIASKYDSATNPKLFALLQATNDRSLHEVGRPSVWTKAGEDLLGKRVFVFRFGRFEFILFFFLSC